MRGYNAPMTNIRDYILDGTPEDVIARYESLPEIAAKSDFGDLDSNVVVVDTETTGFSYTHDELIQIAAAKIEAGAVVDWYVTFVNPGKPLPEEIVHLTGIHEEDVAEQGLVRGHALTQGRGFEDAGGLRDVGVVDHVLTHQFQRGGELIGVEEVDLGKVNVGHGSHEFEDIDEFLGVVVAIGGEVNLAFREVDGMDKLRVVIIRALEIFLDGGDDARGTIESIQRGFL